MTTDKVSGLLDLVPKRFTYYPTKLLAATEGPKLRAGFKDAPV